MRVTPVDPRTPSAAELTAMYDVLCGSFLHDHPGHPPRTREDLRASLTVPWPESRSACWLCVDGEETVGIARLQLPGGTNADVADVALDVLPGHRRGGAGRTLLREAVRLAYSTGRTVLTGQGVEPGPATGFAELMGARPALREVRAVLAVGAAMAASQAEGHEPPAGYELLRIRGTASPDLLEDIGAVHEGMADAPTAPGTWTHQPYDGARVAAVDAMLEARGLTQLRVAARHVDSGMLAGITYVIISPHSPYRSEQGDTVVLAVHRGHSLGLAMKVEMLRWLGAEFPQVGELNTWTARDNAAMRAVNARLGHRDTGTWTQWQVPVHELAGRLGLV